MARAPEEIAPGVYRVDMVGIPNAISVLLVTDTDGWTLVDTGVRSGVLRIQETLSTLGAGPGDLRRIYLTHHHGDRVWCKCVYYYYCWQSLPFSTTWDPSCTNVI